MHASRQRAFSTFAGIERILQPTMRAGGSTMVFRYVPNLRSKTGEAVALENLDPAVKGRTFPVIRLVETPPAGFAPRVAKAWTGASLGLDGLFNFNSTGSTTAFVSLLKQLGGSGVSVIPAVEYGAPTPYVSAVQKLIGAFSAGLVVRVTLADLASVSAWTEAQRWAMPNIDLVVDVGDTAAYKPEMLAKVVIAELSANIKKVSGWRTVTLAAAAAPKDHGALAVGRTDVPRFDWRLWQLVAKSVDFQLDYGDYGIAHPDLTEPPGIAMTRATVSVRYTVQDHWIVIKGRPQTGRTGQPMAKQYLAHAKQLVADPQFDKLATCWGDDRITDIAAGKSTSGNRTTWVQNCVNRHISLVAHQLR